MRKRQISVLHVFILHLCVSGQPEGDIENDEIVHVTAGSDVTLKCILKGNMTVTQMQWSQIVDLKQTMIVVHNPSHGTSYGTLHDTFHNVSAEFKPPSTWLLHLISVAPSQTGQYSCNFATYPYGTKSKIIHLFVQTEEETHSVQEIVLNETFEISCVKNVSSLSPPVLSWKWSMGENGREKILFSSENHSERPYLALGNERIQLLGNYTLSISSATTLDDGRNFSCYVETYQKKIKNTTTLKAFAIPPEISLTIRNISSSEVNLSCIVRKAYPRPRLFWYRNEEQLRPEQGVVSIATKEMKDANGFFELMSVMMLSSNLLTRNQTVWCTVFFSVLGNETQHISSKRISIPLYQENEVTSSSPLSITSINKELQKTSFTTLDQTKMSTSFPHLSYTNSKPSNPSSSLPSESTVTGFQNGSAMNSTGSAFGNQSFWEPPNESSTVPTGTSRKHDGTSATTMKPSSVVTSTVPTGTSRKHEGTSATTMEPFSVVTSVLISTIGGFLTTRKLFNITSSTGMSPHPPITWPILVSILLLICTVLVFFMIRRWCQYRKEILDRPPPFKPPPPPIKYASIQDSDETEASYHELENF
ncbi:T-cell surface protein tactile isoform X2 [Microcaecilia unicolor]|uniref:T-cell surface protein tactile isoform X2 n=1 Tax=Microcaecilia unicolor TaxID=1415580 RepID=A0A6P7XX95_9AMPH|nr:T-cell surface protein tactile isoform X2 [Microcaecilia unicolor]